VTLTCQARFSKGWGRVTVPGYLAVARRPRPPRLGPGSGTLSITVRSKLGSSAMPSTGVAQELLSGPIVLKRALWY
jgi:hypothetical protein